MNWRDMSPAERSEILAWRFRVSREAAWNAGQLTGPDNGVHRAHMARLEAERPDWLRFIREYGGDVALVAKRMGYHRNTAYRTIAILGLRGEVLRARRAAKCSQQPKS